MVKAPVFIVSNFAALDGLRVHWYFLTTGNESRLRDESVGGLGGMETLDNFRTPSQRDIAPIKL